MAELIGVLLAVGLVALATLLGRGLRAVGQCCAGLWRRRPRRGGATGRKGGAGRRLAAATGPLRGVRLRLARIRLRAADAAGQQLAAEVTHLRRALRQAEQECSRLRAAAPDTATAPDRFQQAKRAFALRFHPDRVAAPAAERRLRGAIFQEFWAELRRIERG